MKAWEWSLSDTDDGPLAGVYLEWLETLRRVRLGTLPTRCGLGSVETFPGNDLVNGAFNES